MINLEEEARKRRERLTKTKPETSLQKNEELPAVQSATPSALALPPGTVDASGAEILAVETEAPETLEAQAKALLAAARSTASAFFDPDAEIEVDALVAPKGMNADLKREYEKRTRKLSKKTRRSIVDLVKARLAEASAE
jgi:hypothetical protein